MIMQLAYLMALMTKRFAPPPSTLATASRPHQILDMGCGDGASTAALYYRHPNAVVFGIDLDRASIRGARDNFRRLPIYFDCENPVRTSYPASSFDHIQLHRRTLIESGDVHAILAECRRLLACDGVMCIV